MENILLEDVLTFKCDCGQTIKSFCLDQKCQQAPAFCGKCEQNHSGHKMMVFLIQKLIINNYNINDNIERVINEMIRFDFKKQVNNLIQQLQRKQGEIQQGQRIDQKNFQKIFNKLKNEIEIVGNQFQYKKEFLEDILFPLKQSTDTLIEKLKAIQDLLIQLQVKQDLAIQDLIIQPQVKQDLFVQSYIVKETDTANVQSEILNNSKLVFEQTYCLVHKDQVIDRICLDQRCNKEQYLNTILCENCEFYHKDHRQNVFDYCGFNFKDHHLNKVIFDIDLLQNYKQHMLQHFDQFENNVRKQQPNKLIKNFIDSSQTNEELKQNISKLSNHIKIGEQNSITFQILNQSDFYFCFQEQIQILQKSFNEYWKQDQEPKSQPLQVQFQRKNNFIQSIIQPQIQVRFSLENHSLSLYCCSDYIMKCNEDKSQDVGCLDVSIQNYQGPYIFHIQKLPGIIGIGIARLDQLKKNKFKLNGNDRIDMITSSGYCYNSDDKQFYSKQSGIEIRQGEQYKLTLKKLNDCLDFIFENMNNSQKKFQMEVQYDQKFEYVVFVMMDEYSSKIDIK